MTNPITTHEQMRKAAALLPCPFCGGEAYLSNDASHSRAYFIGCNVEDCFGEIHWEQTKAAAIAAWNRRALPGAKAAPVAVRVKKLVWVDADEGMCTKWRAAALGGHYELVILDKEDGLFSVNFRWGNPLGFWFIQGEPDQFGPTGPKKFPSIEAAKAAAQADHAARILPQIEAIPAAQVRAELAALREAADALAFANARLLQRVRETSADKWMPHAADAADAALATYRTTKEGT